MQKKTKRFLTALLVLAASSVGLGSWFYGTGGAAGGGGDVAIDTTAIASQATPAASTLDLNITVASNSNRVLYVFTHSADDNRAVTSVVSDLDGAFDGSAAISSSDNSDYIRTECWVLTAPSTGAQVITVTWGENQDDLGVTGYSLYNVDQTTPNGTPQPDNTTNPTASVTVPSGGWAIAGVTSDDNTVVEDVGTDEKQVATVGDMGIAIGDRSTTGSLGWATGEGGGFIALPINKAP